MKFSVIILSLFACAGLGAADLAGQNAAVFDAGFRGKVRQASAAAALAVMAEPASTPNHDSRVGLAKFLLVSPESYATGFCTALASQGLGVGSTDQEIVTASANMFSTVAGVSEFPPEIVVDAAAVAAVVEHIRTVLTNYDAQKAAVDAAAVPLKP